MQDSSRQKTYKARLREVLEPYSKNNVVVQASIPRFLAEEFQRWKAARSGCKTSYSKIMALALHFGVYGNHPYDDPLAGIRDAFDRYSETSRDDRDYAKRIIEEIAKSEGLKVRFDD